ncbi:MAG: phosphatase PAP2 family protein [Sedimentisphaerales bacterium]|nr:phosphatase PAP2 family protein [Sedimentisphaerales bacterium]
MKNHRKLISLCLITLLIGCAPTQQQNSNTAYTHWPQRLGPAYPNDPVHSLGRDAKEFLPVLFDDTHATFASPTTWSLFALAGAAGIALEGPNADEPIADHYYRHGHQLNSFWDTVGDAGGNPGTHFALAGALYFTALAQNNNTQYENAKTLLSALALNGIATTTLKIAARTEAPNGNQNVWPSGHTSSTFTLATVLWNQYGPTVGIPLTTFAAYVAYERIDAGNHNFSDVISGALIGIAIGNAVAQNHQLRIGQLTLQPYINPNTATPGLALIHRW